LVLKRWVFPALVEPEKIKTLSQTLNILPVTAAVLVRRGLEGGKARFFLDPSGLRLRNFRDLPATVAAGERIATAIRQQEPIVIFGDYDVDGITAAAMLMEFISRRGGCAEVYLPNRMVEGYGLNKSAVEKMLAAGTKLLITVDCGITAFTEIELARKNGLDVIVTDHHEPASEIPDANVIVNPKVTGPTDLSILAGVGVALQVIRAAAEALGEKDPEQLRRYLDLVALGTVADVVPLINENRSLTRAGLAVINRKKRLGLRALAQVAGLADGPINSTDLAFRLAPRINAAGRLGDARIAFDLLLTNDANAAERLAQLLDQQNSKRQSLEQAVINAAEAKLESLPELPEVIVVSGVNWPLGVVGLAASRLCEKYYRPCFVLAEQNGTAKGSGRSISGFPLHEALRATSALLEKWGGHDMAAGVTLPTKNIEDFKRAMQQQALEKLSEEDKQVVLQIDAEVSLADITGRLIQEFKRFEPYGYKNVRPLLALSKIRVCLPPRVVGERHLKLKITDGQNHFMDAIGFGLGERVQEINMNNLIDIAGHASENSWNNTTSLQIEIKDFRSTSASA